MRSAIYTEPITPTRTNKDGEDDINSNRRLLRRRRRERYAGG